MICDWCKEETASWITTADGRNICNEKDTGPQKGDQGRFYSECWKRGVKLNKVGQK